MTPIRILHCLRAPVGGLFRHVRDLAAAQAAMGHQIAVACDARTGGEAAARLLAGLEDVCELGVFRLPMSRQIGPRDYVTYRKVCQLALGSVGADVLHGHGAKGGAYARLAAHRARALGRYIPAFYTPHGGSLHYDPSTLRGWLYLELEKRLAPMTDGLIFESAFSAHAYSMKVREPTCRARVVSNGLHPEEFYEVVVDADAADFLFVGELRAIKGVDILIQALSRLRRTHGATALIVGSGPEEAAFRRTAERYGLAKSVRFLPPMPARAAFGRARCMVVPSRAESLPYVVLEAAAARMPVIATRVGGIPEIVGGVRMPLVDPGDVVALAEQMAAFLDAPGPFVERAAQLQDGVSKRYTVSGMARTITDFYGERLLHARAEGLRTGAADATLPDR